jgi:hypothetical protein
VNPLRAPTPPDRDDVCLFGGDALVRTRNGGQLHVDGWPDKVERNRPAPDLLAHDEVGTIVIEHTTVVTYTEQVEDNVRARDVFSGFEGRFGAGLERPGRYTLLLDPTDLHLVRREDRDQRLGELETWVRDQRPPYRDDIALGPITAGPPELWVAVQLYRRRCLPEEEGALVWAAVRFPDADVRRRQIVAKALAEKCPKLQAEKNCHPGSVSLLVLGSHDVHMANPANLMKSTYTTAQDFAADGTVTIPDAIIWVDTAVGEGNWIAYVTKNGTWSALAANPTQQGLLLPAAGLGVMRRLRVALPE